MVWTENKKGSGKMSKEFCPVFEDILPLYKEGEVKEDTKNIIEAHLKKCHSCDQLYNENFENVFMGIEFATIEPPKEMRFVRKIKKKLIYAILIILVIFIAANVMAYAVGRSTGAYGERFRLAEQNSLFVEVNKELTFGNEKILLEKVLLDSTVTCLIFKTSVNMNSIDSITLSDDRNNYYTKIHSMFNAVPLKFQNLNGYTILNFKPVAKELKELAIELIDWKKDGQSNEYDKRAVFDIKINPESIQTSIAEKYNIFTRNYADFCFTVDRFIQSSSQTELWYKLDFEKSKYDGLTIGWCHQDYINNKDKIAVWDTATGDIIPVLSTEDITQEILIKNPELKKTSLHKILLNPIRGGNKSINLEFEDVYGYYSLENEELEVDMKNQSSVIIDKKIEAGKYYIDIISAEKRADQVFLSYSVKDEEGTVLKDFILDARLRRTKDKEAVPQESKFEIGNEMNTIMFDVAEGDAYVVNLVRLGERIDMGNIKIDVK